MQQGTPAAESARMQQILDPDPALLTDYIEVLGFARIPVTVGHVAPSVSMHKRLMFGRPYIQHPSMHSSHC